MHSLESAGHRLEAMMGGLGHAFGKELVNTAPEEALKGIADGLSKMENPAQRAAAAVAIFGKAGQGMLPMLLGGAEALSAAQREAEKLGLTFSRLDAAKVELANEAM